MRTNVVISDDLLAGAKTRREVVDLGPASLIRLKKQEEIRQPRGKLRWVGDPEKMRRDG